MRLLLVSDHYPPYIGGAHRQTKLLADQLSARGHQVSVATVWDGALPRVERSGEVTVYRLGQLRTLFARFSRAKEQRHHPPFPDPVTVAELRRIVNRVSPDVIHAHGWIAYSAAAALVGKRIPLLLSARDYGYFCATRTLVYEGKPCSGPGVRKCLTCAHNYYAGPRGWVSVAGVAASKHLLARKITAVHSVSRYVERMTVPRLTTDEPARPRRSFVIPSFLHSNGSAEPPADYEPWLSQLPDTPFILYVGAFRKVKGLETLFDAYGRLDSPPPLVLIGTVERDAPDRFPPGAIIIENAPQPAVLAAWQRALFGVLPSLWPEPFGATVAEAMSAGKTVIGTTPGGHIDMLEGCGILIPSGDVDRLAEAMRGLLDDPALRERLGEAARVRAQDFRAESVVPRFEGVYAQLAPRGARAA